MTTIKQIERLFLNLINNTNLIKLLKIIIVALSCTLFCFSCTASIRVGRDQDSVDCAKKFCERDPMVGKLSGVRSQIEAKRDELKSLKINITSEKYSQLSQELNDYSTKWEILDRNLHDACMKYAICECKLIPAKACKEESKEMEEAKKNAYTFFKKVEELEDNILPKLDKPIISPPSKIFTESIKIFINSATPGAKIHYTIDGNEPTENSPIYDKPLRFSNSVTLKAKGFKNNYISSDTVIETYKKKVSAPSIEPPSTNFIKPITVSISCSTPNAIIYFTKDGSEPTESSTIYDGPLRLTDSLTIKAKAFKNGFIPSDTAIETYTKSDGSVKKYLTLSIAALSGGLSFYFWKESEDYNNRYMKEWDRNEALKIKNKTKDYREYSVITASVSVLSLVCFYFLNKNMKSRVEINPTLQNVKLSLVSEF